MKKTKIVLENNAPFISFVSKISGALIDNTKDLDIMMPMYNLIKYSKNYSKTSGSLWNYCSDEIGDKNNDNPNKNIIKSNSFK